VKTGQGETIQQNKNNATTGVKRYNLVIPEVLYDQIQQLAEEEHTTVVDLIRRFIKLGLIAAETAKKPGASLIIREDGRDREIIFLT
jgi:hypothetical protein